MKYELYLSNDNEPDVLVLLIASTEAIKTTIGAWIREGGCMRCIDLHYPLKQGDIKPFTSFKLELVWPVVDIGAVC